jgi:hypothetical protein
MDLTTHKQLAIFLNTASAALRQMHKVCVKGSGPDSKQSVQIKGLLKSLSSVKEHLLTDAKQITQTHINPYGK